MTALAQQYSKFKAHYERLNEWILLIKNDNEDANMTSSSKLSLDVSGATPRLAQISVHGSLSYSSAVNEASKEPMCISNSIKDHHSPHNYMDHDRNTTDDDIEIYGLCYQNSWIAIKDWSLYAKYDPANPPVIQITGSSGCGKSTLLKIIKGLISADSGSIKYPRKQSIFLSQIPYLVPRVDLYTQLYYPQINSEFTMDNSSYQRAPRVHMDEIVELLTLFGLAHLIERRNEIQYTVDMDTLSLGEAQRLVIVRTLLKKPLWVWMDEPFASLEIEWRTLTLKILKKYGVGAIIIKH